MRVLLQLRTPFVSSEVETRGHAQALLDFARSERFWFTGARYRVG
jgi:hypothetical protein